jgi:radical SAM protein with 4Fe4S-binding SPASM domain
MRRHERLLGLLKTPRLLFEALALGRYDFVYDRLPVALRGMPLAKRLNLVTAGTHLVRRHAHVLNMPLHMQFELTSYCNLRCPGCPTGTKDLNRPPMAMDPAAFERVWNEVGPYLLTASLWGWGEPLLHPQLAEILRIARRHGVATLLSTNGMPLANPAVRAALLDYPPATLIVAIDGLTDETNTRYRIGAKLETILEGVKALVRERAVRQQHGPDLQLRFIAMRHNEHEVARLESFAREHGFDRVTIRSIVLHDVTGAVDVQRGLEPDAEQLQPHPFGRGERGHHPGFVCTMPFWFPSIQADGGIVGCEQDHSGQQRMGKVEGTTGFRAIWFGRRAADVRRTIRDNPMSLSFCRTCPYADRPTSDCSIESRYLGDGSADIVVGTPA